jgi:beta-lactamase class A
LSALCEAAIEVSDNTAANLLLGTMGGPAGVTRMARALGDDVTRLDRNEPALNTAIPGDSRDTTTPAAMLKDLKEIVLGKTLSDASRQMLEGWMAGNKISQRQMRAGLPAEWRVADKTGGGGYHSRNDIAVLRPPGRAPIVASVYFAESDLPNEALDATLADVGRVIADAF